MNTARLILLIVLGTGCPAAFLLPQNNSPTPQSGPGSYKYDVCTECVRNRNDCDDGRTSPMLASCSADYRSCLNGNGVSDADCH